MEELSELTFFGQLRRPPLGHNPWGLRLHGWAHARGIELAFIEPGKPVQNAYVESFSGKQRDEYLNRSWFHSLAEAKRVIDHWR